VAKVVTPTPAVAAGGPAMRTARQLRRERWNILLMTALQFAVARHKLTSGSAKNLYAVAQLLLFAGRLMAGFKTQNGTVVGSWESPTVR